MVLSQSELARLAKIPVTTLNGIMSDKSLPRADNIKKLAIALHTTTDRLLFDDDEINADDELKRLFAEVSRMRVERQRTAKDMLKAIIIQNKSEEIANI
ncbi:helix-turn-helix domain-containing protein [Moraxella bovis]|uniref:helix-turn-helix domain-containing protein n=1 Tax=Moraxella bovis TaxID=476 RepID=UPI0022273072|nr:helix-turn-helix transcriptional regulator [Moraxella bovis]